MFQVSRLPVVWHELTFKVQSGGDEIHGHLWGTGMSFNAERGKKIYLMESLNSIRVTEL